MSDDTVHLVASVLRAHKLLFTYTECGCGADLTNGSVHPVDWTAHEDHVATLIVTALGGCTHE